MNNNQFVISIGDHKKVIFAKILSESRTMTCVISMANTHTNRRLVAEKDVSDLKSNCNCTIHTYKMKNYKYKTVHKCLVYNFMNTQDRLTFMDNLVRFVASRRFPNIKRPLQIHELIRTKGKDSWIISTRKLKENPHASVSPKPKVYYTKKKKCNLAKETHQTSSESQQTDPTSNQGQLRPCTILQIPIPKTHLNLMNIKKKKILLESKQRKPTLYLQKRATVSQSRPVTRSLTRKSMQTVNSKSNPS